jgi:Transposase DDE domain
MLDGATKAFVQGHNGQAAVDCSSQVIVAADVTQRANDKQQSIPLMEQIEDNLGGIPDRALADAGYFLRRGGPAERANSGASTA